MRKLLMVVSLAGFVSALPAHAAQQDSPGGKGQKPAADRDSMKPITITGCVAQSGTVYRLDHAVIAVDTDIDTQNRPATEASPTPKMMSYALVGTDVKAHVGHKVEVTGTMSSSKTSKDAAGIKEIPGMKLVGTLNVKSVKMVSNSCP